MGSDASRAPRKAQEQALPRTEQARDPADRGPAWRFAALWATGPDTSLDGVFRLLALRPGVDGGWERFDRYCAPFPDSDLDGATARMMREFGVTGADLEGAPPAAGAFAEFCEFLAGGPVVAADAASFRAWYEHLAESPGGPPEGLLGLDGLTGLFFPGRREARRQRAWGPLDVQRELATTVARFLALEPEVVRLATLGWTRSFRGLREEDPDAGRMLELALTLADRPSEWAGDTGELFPAGGELRDGVLASCLGVPWDELCERIWRGLDDVQPACARSGEEWLVHRTIPVEGLDPVTLAPEDVRLVDDVFQVHLPALIAGDDALGEGLYREGQHQVAREVSGTLGGEELLLVHAPTGTGKTLAYLVPAMLWSIRNDVRVGVSTYTRALQEQAVDQEVPRALQALSRAGVKQLPRVCLLKGRANYLCWRALCLHVPGDDDSAHAWLAWTTLCLFGLTDTDGDLDRFPVRSALDESTHYKHPSVQALNALIRGVRAQTACCSAKEDRATCAAEVARLKAERSHVVVTNHSFALARQAFFKHVIFDECEHLHDQAHAAWSHSISVRELRDFTTTLRQPGRPVARAPLDRLEQTVPPGGAAREALDECIAAWFELLAALDGLDDSLASFKDWRNTMLRAREQRDQHSLLREFIESVGTDDSIPGALDLLRDRVELQQACAALETGLSSLAGELDTVPMRGIPRLRRTLELARAALIEHTETINAWIPIDEGEPKFRPQTFHDLEVDMRGNDVLAARVLLPNEYLGRYYYPQLSSAVLISATTWLRGGFEGARGYLGLDRAAEPARDEEREPRTVRTFRAPDPFDYRRVLVCVPQDAPAYGRDRKRFDEYVRKFIAHLGERTRGRMLVLFTNAEDVRRTGQELSGFFRARRIPFWFQNMPGLRKEELGDLFRSRTDSVLMGVDTFWYGADFPGETLEYLVIVKLPFGVPDRYHQAQCAVLGQGGQRKRIYMPRALGKFRQGFGRLMRRESDRGAVFVLDGRVLRGQNREFLAELPVESGLGDADSEWRQNPARLLVADTDDCVHEALSHMNMLADVKRRGLDTPLAADTPRDRPPVARPVRRSRGRDQAPRVREPSPTPQPPPRVPDPEILDIPTGDLPF